MSYPKLINIYVTNLCNLNCRYCYRKSEKSISTTSYTQIESLIPELSKHNFSIVHLTGGEPFLWDGLEKTLQILKEAGFSTTVTTNGTVDINESIFKYLDKIIFSIDGKEDTMSYHRTEFKFNKILNNISKLRTTNVVVEFNTVITDYNRHKFANEITSLINENSYKDLISKINFIEESKLQSGEINEKDVEKSLHNIKKIIENFNFKIDYNYNILKRHTFFELIENNLFKYPIWFDLSSKKFYVNKKSSYNSIIEVIMKYDFDARNIAENFENNKYKYIDPMRGII